MKGASADVSHWWRLVSLGQGGRADARAASRRRTRLQSAKILNGSGAFLCEATVQDVSVAGLRVLLARNCGLPARLGVHIDLTGEIVTATVAWRRERMAGLRIVAHEAPAPLNASERAALRGRYYAVRG